MKAIKKIDKKLADRMKGFSEIDRQFQQFGGRAIPPGKFTRPGSRNRKKG